MKNLEESDGRINPELLDDDVNVVESFAKILIEKTDESIAKAHPEPDDLAPAGSERRRMAGAGESGTRSSVQSRAAPSYPISC